MVSIGGYFKNLQSEQTIEDCLQIADSLLYQAKENGRNCVMAMQP